MKDNSNPSRLVSELIKLSRIVDGGSQITKVAHVKNFLDKNMHMFVGKFQATHEELANMVGDNTEAFEGHVVRRCANEIMGLLIEQKVLTVKKTLEDVGGRGMHTWTVELEGMFENVPRGTKKKV